MAFQDSRTFHWHYAEFDDGNFQIHGRTLFFVVALLCVFLVILLIYLYARWVCRYGPPNSGGRLVHEPAQERAPPRGLDPTIISNLPIILHRDSSNPSEAECCICLGIFQDGEKVKVLPNCRHCYHCVCVDKWLRNQSSCPLCRASLRVDSSV